MTPRRAAGPLALVLLTAVMWSAHLTVLFGPTASADDMRYVSVAVDPYESAHIVNRYAHVYGIRLVYLMTGSGPLAGALCGLIYSTILSVLAYAFAKRRRGAMAGLLAAALTWIVLLIISPPTIAFPDVPMSAYLGLAVWSATREARTRHGPHRWTTFLVGFLFLLAFKSKETALAALPVLVWLRYESEDRSWRRVILGIVPGVLAGLLLLAILDQIFLGNALFGVDPRSYMSHLEFNIPDTRLWTKARGSYPEILTVGSLIGVVALCAISVVWRTREDRAVRACVLWSVSSVMLHGLLLVPGAHAPSSRYLISILWPLLPLAGETGVRAGRDVLESLAESPGAFARASAVTGLTFVGIISLAAKYSAKVVVNRLFPVVAVAAVFWWAVAGRRARLWRGLCLGAIIGVILVAALREARIQTMRYRTIHDSWSRLLEQEEVGEAHLAVVEGDRMVHMLPHKLTALIGARPSSADIMRLQDVADLPRGWILLASRPLEAGGLTPIVEPDEDRFGAVWAYRRRGE